MLKAFPLINEMYPTITMEEYSTEPDNILPNNYKQLVVFEGEDKICINGYWVENKLW